jgi:hypothetical protein
MSKASKIYYIKKFFKSFFNSTDLKYSIIITGILIGIHYLSHVNILFIFGMFLFGFIVKSIKN